MKDLIAELEKRLEFVPCEISKTNNQYKHGRRAENARLKPLHAALIECVKFVDSFANPSKEIKPGDLVVPFNSWMIKENADKIFANLAKIIEESK